MTLPSSALTWSIAGLATAGVIVRPFKTSEAVWAVAGAMAVVLLGLLPVRDAWRGVLKGQDVYMFLVGMMLLSELARQHGFFGWLAALATVGAKGSATRLFALTYAVGILVTIFLSNDATAIVLTPAVYASARAAKVSDPLPYLMACAFIANAASFVLPISNPANLVVFGGGHLPALLDWLSRFGLPSVLAIASTFLAQRFVQRHALRDENLSAAAPMPPLSLGGRIAGAGIIASAIVLVAASTAGANLGLATLAVGGGCTLLVQALSRKAPLSIVRHVSWDVIVLVAALFVLVEALDHTGLTGNLATVLQEAIIRTPRLAAFASAAGVALLDNTANNLPVGLVAGSIVHHAALSRATAGALLIGVDLGPNLSVTGSLATILWLAALRREGLYVTAWTFLKLGAIVMPPALIVSVGALILVH